MRILLYSHDSFGLGHLRRSTTIAGELMRVAPGARVRVATGSPFADRWPMPSGVEVVRLPQVAKNVNGGYESRRLGGDLDRALRTRARILEDEVRGFRPDVLLVDNKPSGLLGELRSALEAANELGTKCLLGLRDIVDDPRVVSEEWRTVGASQLLSDVYDGVLVYGSPHVYPTADHLTDLHPVRDRLHYTGYVARRTPELPWRPLALLRPHVVVTVGGGEDGAERLFAYVESSRHTTESRRSTIVLGPMLPPDASERLREEVGDDDSIRLLPAHQDLPALLRDASVVVSMAGYNTTAEILQSRVPSVLLPRTVPRVEQRIRAERLAELGLATMAIDPTPAELNSLVEAAIARGRVTGALPDFGGAHRVASRLAALALGDDPCDQGCRPSAELSS